MFYQLPPAGDLVSLHKTADSTDQLQNLFSPWVPRFFASGTASLAAAFKAAVDLRNYTAPEVILPAYGCPDLVSAALFAGVKPVLVDFEYERPWMDLDQVAARISPSTVAVVAVNLFGIPERHELLREIIGQRPIVLIEDSAQFFPPEADEGPWQGDLVVLSFGRGKPVSLLGGGAVLYRDATLGGHLPQVHRGTPDKLLAEYLFRIKAGLYNMASQPRLYWILHGMPFLHLGETRFHPLATIGPMDSTRHSLLAGNLEAYRGRGNQVRIRLADMLAKLSEDLFFLIDLPELCGVPSQSRLLRYPLLVAADMRDDLLRLLNNHGLGATGMYPSSLPSITGLGSLLLDQGPFPGADDFARRIVTLPTHSRVRDADVEAVVGILRQLSR